MSDTPPTTAPAAAPAPALVRQSDRQGQILMAIVKAKRGFKSVTRQAQAAVADEGGLPRFYRYASLASHMDAISEALLEADLVLEQDVTTMRGGVNFLSTTLTHAPSEQWRRTYLPLPLNMRDDPRRIGGTLTYFRRYGLANMLGLAAQDDDEEPGSVAAPLRDITADYPPIDEDPGAGGGPGPDLDEPVGEDAFPQSDAPPAEPEAPPPPPPNVNTVIRAMMLAAANTAEPGHIWLDHASFLSNLSPSMRERTVDRWRAKFGEPPHIVGLTYPEAVTAEDAEPVAAEDAEPVAAEAEAEPHAAE